MYEEITIEEYQDDFAERDDVQVVDVREADEYAEGHVPGAINIPLSDLQGRYQEIDKAKPVVLVCAKGGRSAMAAELITMKDYSNVYNLLEGTLGWQERGLPTDK